jgi:hypothetical protein
MDRLNEPGINRKNVWFPAEILVKGQRHPDPLVVRRIYRREARANN